MTKQVQECEAQPESAATVFGDRTELAAAYARLLADEGVLRGLIGPSEPARLWTRHLLNCGVLSEAIEQDESVVDIGSGAGLPGIPLAIARPDVSVTLVEPLLRRTVFLDEVVEELGLDNVTVVRGRAEEAAVRAEVGEADVCTSRAVAPLDRLAKWSAPLIRVGGRLVALKGSSAPEEIAAHREAVARLGLTGLRTVTIGEGIVDPPSIAVVGDRVAVAADGKRRRSAKKR
ncbi:MAG: 16S rRNA (guanine(527)-N(7))-methyltransferase RsmG [Gordonia sp. (in: high G+C Gram-positive bacteria)]|uniref:16S rRNA (guanine(527)-N(7))-methyltransferase RsmG n=1 Tax=Gordonia sp. (in: high G+C Gram-positive bacteria) TaxID=84139 RepID=UPI0039E528DC